MKNKKKTSIPSIQRGPAQSAISYHLKLKGDTAKNNGQPPSDNEVPLLGHHVDDDSILDIDASEYQAGLGKTIRIRIKPELQQISVFMTISNDDGEVEKGEAKHSVKVPGTWTYKTKRKRPTSENLVVSAWVLDFYDGFAEMHVDG